MKFRLDGVYTIVAIFESRSVDERTKLYKIKSEGRGPLTELSLKEPLDYFASR